MTNKQQRLSPLPRSQRPLVSSECRQPVHVSVIYRVVESRNDPVFSFEKIRAGQICRAEPPQEAVYREKV
jgi:hypothetical protein